MDTARLRLPKRSVIALVLALLAMFVLPSAAAGDGASHSSRVERFLLMSTDPSSTDGQPVLGWGPIHAKGVDHVVSDTQDVFEFPAGTLSVTHTAQHSHSYFDPATCLATYVERGTYRITAGTDAYDGASGHGHYRAVARAIGCDQNAAPDVFTLTINAWGPLHIS